MEKHLIKVWAFTVSACNRVIVSYWIPDQDRWSGYMKETPPVLFCDAPTLPKGLNE